MTPSRPLRIAWFSTGRGPGSRALLRDMTAAIDAGLPVEIACVFCNREWGEDPATDELLRLVESCHLPLVMLSSARFRRRSGGVVVRKGDPLPRWRLDYDDEVLGLLRPFGVTLGMLAGYMLIFGPRACAEMTLLNLHPAAPGGPIGIWQDVIWQLIDARAAASGITIFRAVPEVDTGPPISFCLYPLRGAGIDELWQRAREVSAARLTEQRDEALPLFQEIRRRGARREPAMVIETLRALAGPGGLERAGIETEPVDLTETVNVALATNGAADHRALDEPPRPG